MRLYLASFRAADSLDELYAMADPVRRVAVVANAVDFIPPDQRAAYARTVHDPLADFRDRGLTAFDLDLRRFFGRPEALAAELDDVGLVWATGGNAFLLRRAMRQSGFDALIGDLLLRDRLAYGGWSAGAVVAGPSLIGLDAMDRPDVLAEGYEAPVVWEGLGLIPEIVVPHVRSQHTESAAAGNVVARLRALGEPFIALRDGEALVMTNGPLTLRPTAEA
jgi:dipeptidase E